MCKLADLSHGSLVMWTNPYSGRPVLGVTVVFQDPTPHARFFWMHGYFTDAQFDKRGEWKEIDVLER